MTTPSLASRFARSVLYRFQSTDVRPWAINDTIRRAQMAVLCASGTLLGGVGSRPKRKRRWCVLRSPHVHKTSREHFVMITNFRNFRWSIGADAESGIAREIAGGLPANVATRITETTPGFLRLPEIYRTMMESKKGREEAEKEDGKEGSQHETAG